MKLEQFRLKPVTVEAVQLVLDTTPQEAIEIAEWCHGQVMARWPYNGDVVGLEFYGGPKGNDSLLRAAPGDWIVKNPHGIFYLYDAGTFAMTFDKEPIDD